MYSRRLLLSLIVIVLLNAGGCQSQPVVTGFDVSEAQIVGLELYARQHSDAEPQQLINLSDKQLTQRLLTLLEPLTGCDPPPEDWAGAREALVFKYVLEEHTITASKQYPYWHQPDGPAFLELEDGWHQVPAEFAAQLALLAQYPEATSDIDPADTAFLKQYGWTVFCKIKSYNGRLPDKFLHQSGEYPVVLYYAYNNELSKDIGLDLSPYLGRDVTVNLYKLEEPLPDFMAPRQKANRAIIVKDGEQIIAAWLDAGRHHGFACSLKGRRLEDITGKPWGEWVNQYIDHRNEQEILISRMQPEEVIEAYFEAVDHKDSRTAHACETRERLVASLFTNMDNNRLYNYSYATNDADWINNINRAKVITIQPYNLLEQDDQEVVKKYVVVVDLNVKRLITHDSGRQVLYMTLRRETPTTGWRIADIGTAP